jgi:flagellar protein FliO/FliZ
VIAALVRGAVSTPRGRTVALLAAVPLAGVLVLSPGPTAAIGARAALVVAAIAAAAAWVRRRPQVTARPALSVVARAPLGSGAGLAVVEVGGRRLVVGFGRDGVSLIAELGGPGEARP